MGRIRRRAADFRSEAVHGPACEHHAARPGSDYRSNDRPRTMNRAPSMASDPRGRPARRRRFGACMPRPDVLTLCDASGDVILCPWAGAQPANGDDMQGAVGGANATAGETMSNDLA